MNNTEQQIERYLGLLDEGVLSPREARAVICDEFGDDSTCLELATALREVALPTDETSAARERVRLRLANALVAERLSTTHEQHHSRETPDLRPILATVSMPIRLPARRSQRLRRRAIRVALAAAVLLAACWCGWTATTFASSALPGTALYSVKRLEEQVALATAWSDDRRVTVISTVADRRLTEAHAEADQGNDTTARQLLAEFDNNVHQLIYLDALMTSQHATTTGVSKALNTLVDKEVTVLTVAQQKGQTSFAAALAANLSSEDQVAHANAIALPASAQNAAGQPTGAPGGGTPSHGPARPASTGTPNPIRTATPGKPTTPSSGNGNGRGNGGSNGSHGGNGAPANGTPTPSPSPSPSATANATPPSGNGNGNGNGKHNGTATVTGNSNGTRHGH